MKIEDSQTESFAIFSHFQRASPAVRHRISNSPAQKWPPKDRSSPLKRHSCFCRKLSPRATWSWLAAFAKTRTANSMSISARAPKRTRLSWRRILFGLRTSLRMPKSTTIRQLRVLLISCTIIVVISSAPNEPIIVELRRKLYRWFDSMAMTTIKSVESNKSRRKCWRNGASSIRRPRRIIPWTKCSVQGRLLGIFSMRMTLCLLLLRKMVRFRLFDQKKKLEISRNITTKLLFLNFHSEYDLFEVEDVFAELQELVSKNRFQDGDLISKSSHQRVKRKSGKMKVLFESLRTMNRQELIQNSLLH